MNYCFDEAAFAAEYEQNTGRQLTAAGLAPFRAIALWAIEAYEAGIVARPLTDVLPWLKEAVHE